METQEATGPQAQDDISPKTLLVLVVLVLVVSFIGAWVSISQIATPSLGPPGSEDGGSSSAKIGFSIQPPEVPEPDATSGRVALDIVAPE